MTIEKISWTGEHRDMNEDLILDMVRPYVKNGSVTYEQFDSIYDMLSLKEKYAVSDILYKNGINLIGEEEWTDGEGYILEMDEGLDGTAAEAFQVLYDEGLFKDGTYSEADETNLVINRTIKQSNEILCALIQQGNKQAVQDLCVKNKRLVDKYVIAYQKKYGNRLDFDDLEQVGFMGLIRAAEKFESCQGNTFSTYAVWWIKQAISREIMDNGYMIRIPVHMMERINKVGRVESRYIDLDKGERIKKISEELSMNEKDVRECLVLRKNYLSCASLNVPIGEEEDTELGEVIPKEDAPSVEDIVIGRELKRAIEEAISTLGQREQEVLRLRFGLDGGKEKTLEEIGKQLNVTRERIRQMEEKALNRLRHSSQAKKIEDYLNG